jgi:chemotaxis methyl-accepting protein methylase
VNDDAIEAVAQLLARRVGLRLDHAIRARLVSAVRDEAARHGLGLDGYVEVLSGNGDALQALLNRVTVQETSFFRDPGQFAALAADVLPALRDSGAPVRLWSAGCANGQEAYSLAMTLAESGITDWRVVASDLSTEALARTRAGRYSEREIRGLNDVRRARYLVSRESQTPTGAEVTEWEVNPDLRSRVRVVRHNLVAEPPPFPAGECQVVFCRNVLIYFDRDNTVALLDRLAAWLPAGGHLFLGYSESLWDLPSPFTLVRLGEAFAYLNPPRSADHRPRSGPATAPAPAPPATPRSRAVGLPADGRTAPSSVAPLGAGTPDPAPDGVLTVRPLAVEAPATHDLVVDGDRALAGGDPAAAVASFRQVVFLEPDNPVGYLHLGLALEALGDETAARRAFAAGRAALDRCDPAAVEAVLDGYQFEDLARLLDRRTEQR